MSKPRTKEIPAQQGISAESATGQVGYCQPPEDSQFKPGQSGNPKGSPKARTNLWKFINRFMAMTDDELAKVDRETLTQAQKVALKLVERAAQGNGCDSERLTCRWACSISTSSRAVGISFWSDVVVIA